jgi:hypothetical protein
MGEILLAGTTHYPLLLYTDDAMTSQMERHWKSDRVPDWWKDQKNWPKEMQKEYGPDGRNGLASAAAHRQRLVEGFRRVREEIDAFNPDFVLIWGDDQYENFHEDLVPPFSIYICDKFETQPFRKRRFNTDGTEVFNVWGEHSDHVFTHQGHPEAAKYLTTRLLEMGYAMPYAYKTLHFQGLPHAFLNTLAFLDYDRKGFPCPVIPFHVNCYGSSFVKNRGGSPLQTAADGEPDPPAPSARLCFEVGAATARALKDSRYRAVLLGSSSWSHAFLVDKHHMLWPDIEADRTRFEELRDGKASLWRDLSMKDIEEAGQQEFLNWICLGGALTELAYKPRIIDFIQTYIFNSSKCFMTARAD